MIGSSGVGKSTILNRLLGDERQRTFAVREGDNRGRHTTVTRELFRMPGGWLLIDMPGLREVQLWAATEGLDDSFEEIQALAAACRFRDCTHENEPGCAVLAAGLDAGRMENYRKMRRELAHLERKADPVLRKEVRAKWNATEKSVRKNDKRNR
jgi:ribosome biogenesis GTPase